MTLALALSLALITQQGTTLALEVDGSVKQFHLYWNLTNELILELDGTQVTYINQVTPLKPVSITFDPLRLNLPPSIQRTSPYRCTLADQNGSCVLAYQYTSIDYGADPTNGKQCALLGFQFSGATQDTMSPYTFMAFNYGASALLTLYPASGVAQDIDDVISGKSQSVYGSGVFTQAITLWNSLVYPQPWRPRSVSGIPY